MLFHHLTVRAYRLDRPLVDPLVAPCVWTALRRAFPLAIATVLMPDHPHVVTPGDDAEDLRMRLARVVSGFRRSRWGESSRWERVPPPDPLTDVGKLRRHVRYVALNPNRAKLVTDPLAWLWSTHRDVVGAVIDPWVEAGRLAFVFGSERERFSERHHAYVSGDPSVAVAGTSPPATATAGELALRPLGDVLAAAVAAHRAVPEDVRRKTAVRATFFDLARDAGWQRPELLARVARCSVETVHRHWQRRRPTPAAAWLCFGDARLRFIASQRR